MSSIGKMAMALSSLLKKQLKPRLIILGAQKAGTTALYEMLCKHPWARPPKQKELHHFAWEWHNAQGMGHYLSSFPRVPRWDRRGFTFEASPSYLFHAHKVAPRIKAALPEVICLAILRDPVKRAFSAWNMNHGDLRYEPGQADAYDPRSFQQAVEDELAGRTEKPQHRYLERGNYAEQIATFQQCFPSDQLLVRSYLDFKRDPDRSVQDICTHLGIPPMPAHIKLTSVRANTRRYTEKLDPGLAAELYRYYVPALKKLNSVLGHRIDILEDPR